LSVPSMTTICVTSITEITRPMISRHLFISGITIPTSGTGQVYSER
jgi:hypothetical protein